MLIYESKATYNLRNHLMTRKWMKNKNIRTMKYPHLSFQLLVFNLQMFISSPQVAYHNTQSKGIFIWFYTIINKTCIIGFWCQAKAIFQFMLNLINLILVEGWWMWFFCVQLLITFHQSFIVCTWASLPSRCFTFSICKKGCASN